MMLYIYICFVDNASIVVVLCLVYIYKGVYIYTQAYYTHAGNSNLFDMLLYIGRTCLLPLQLFLHVSFLHRQAGPCKTDEYLNA